MTTKKKRTPRTINPIQKFLNQKEKLYYSDFCLTDNDEFALFYIDRKFLVDNKVKMRLNKFTLSENELLIEIDRTKKIEPEKNIRKFKFENYGLVKKEIIDMFYHISNEAAFFKVKSIFGKRSNNVFIVLSEEFGKPIGIVTTKK